MIFITCSPRKADY